MFNPSDGAPDPDNLPPPLEGITPVLPPQIIARTNVLVGVLVVHNAQLR
jgi:hypothetical protein